jgi:ATP/maltotriose-dependent transcriptional regulator MalT
VTAAADSLLADALGALKLGEWLRAKASFEAALKTEESAEALLGLANALWWLGETQASIRHLERAYAAFRRRPDPAQAAVAAINLCLTFVASLGNQAAARGWFGRARRLVDEFQLDALRGWVLLCRAVIADEEGQPVAAERWAREAYAVARRDRDLELCALSELGSALMAMGRVEEGAALLDEAMAGSLSGEVQSLDTVVLTSCNTMISCSRTGDFKRARQWISAADEFNRRYGSPHLYAVCRTQYGSVLFATGKWAEAEQELRAALEISSGAEPAVRAEALAKLAALRLAQGQMEESARLIEGVSEQPTSVPVTAAINLAQRQPKLATAVLERRLGEIAAECLEAAVLLDLLTEAAIVSGTVPTDLVVRANRIAKHGAYTHCQLIVAYGDRALGRLLAAENRPEEAARHLEHALAGFRDLHMLLDVERTRVLLARALAADIPEVAIAEAKRALTGFEEIGAARDADGVAGFLRSLGVNAARTGPKGVGLLTSREREVLGLLGEGLSNLEIAERLVVSRKTVEHHVARVLSKLGVRGRAEAAAHAIRQLSQERDSATR